jgi:uncharacterized membrane protein YeaQ/YmgE (transglycosylase-associated protein family)
MTFLFIFLITGIAVGAGMNSLMNNRGNALGFPLSVGLGAAASLVTGVLLVNFGKLLVGDGPDFLLALIGGPVAAVIVILLVRVIKR